MYFYANWNRVVSFNLCGGKGVVVRKKQYMWREWRGSAKEPAIEETIGNVSRLQCQEADLQSNQLPLASLS